MLLLGSSESDQKSNGASEKDPTSVLKMELGDVLGRYNRPPPFDKRAKLLAPFDGGAEAWVPAIWRKEKDSDKFELVAPKSPWKALDRVLVLVQDRIRAAGNQAAVAAWVNYHLPSPPKVEPKFENGKKVRQPAPPGTRLVTGTVLYREMFKNIVGGDARQGAYVPHVNSDVVAATSRRLDQLCTRLWAPKIKKAVVLDDRWPVFFRPSGWRLLDGGKSIAFNVDGTWWHVELRVPRPKQKLKAKLTRAKARKMAYVNAALKRLTAGESDRGVSAKLAPVSDDKWIPSTLGLVKNAKDGKWTAIMSYRYPARPVYPVQNALVVHCGLRAFATYQDTESMLAKRGAEYVRGTGLLARRYQFRLQRKRLMRSARKFAAAGRGHKYQARAFRTQGIERAYVDDWLRRRARRIAAIARERKAVIFVGTLDNVRNRVEARDLPKGVKIAVHQAPWFKFRQYIAEAAAKIGVPCETYRQVSHTQRCPNPACGERGKATIDYRKWEFTCESCGDSRGIDSVVTSNAIWDLAYAGRVSLPQSLDYQTFFDKIDMQRDEDEWRKREARERAHLAGVADKFGKRSRHKLAK